jgi:hypothetical protein
MREIDVGERLAVIESKLETLIEEITIIRAHVPEEMVEHSQRICVLERAQRTTGWVAGVIATAAIGAFVAHIFGGG